MRISLGARVAEVGGPICKLAKLRLFRSAHVSTMHTFRSCITADKMAIHVISMKHIWRNPQFSQLFYIDGCQDSFRAFTSSSSITSSTLFTSGI